MAKLTNKNQLDITHLPRNRKGSFVGLRQELVKEANAARRSDEDMKALKELLKYVHGWVTQAEKDKVAKDKALKAAKDKARKEAEEAKLVKEKAAKAAETTDKPEDQPENPSKDQLTIDEGTGTNKKETK